MEEAVGWLDGEVEAMLMDVKGSIQQAVFPNWVTKHNFILEIRGYFRYTLLLNVLIKLGLAPEHFRLALQLRF